MPSVFEYRQILKHNSNVLNELPKFLGRPRNGLWLGVELEVSLSSEGNGGWRELSNFKKNNSFINLQKTLSPNLPKSFLVAKHDGSVSDGYEIVTAPASMNVHQKFWPQIIEGLDKTKLTINSTCGMHVHVNRSSFAKIDQLYFFHNFVNRPTNANWIVGIAGRNSGQWATRYEKDSYRIQKDSDDIYCAKYEAVNLKPKHTVEVRIFKSTTNLHQFMYRLEFVDALAQWCISRNSKLKPNLLTPQNLAIWLENEKGRYGNLWQYLQSTTMLNRVN